MVLFYNHLRYLLINSLSDRLVQISSKHCQSQTGRARELKLWDSVHPTLCVTCHRSPVTCKKKSFSFFLLLFIPFFLSLNKNGPSGGASRWRVCYQWGLPCLVYMYFVIKCLLNCNVKWFKNLVCPTNWVLRIFLSLARFFLS